MSGKGWRFWGLLAVGLGLAATARAGAPKGPEPDVERLKAHVATLASPAFAGRRGAGAAKAAAYVEAAFRKLKLEPLFGDSFVQPIPGPTPERPAGRNVGAILRGTAPAGTEPCVVLSAHFDHVGVRSGVLFPGADDNASGVAMLLESARILSESPRRLRRDVLFVGFDLEEDGLWGSRHFVAHPPVPLERFGLFLTADMIARALGGVCDDYVFVLGTEHSPHLRGWVEQAAEGRPLKVGLVGTDLLVIDRSDYGPFRAKEVPYLFFSTGENPAYHHPTDVPETLDYPKFAAISGLILDVVRHAADAEALPGWSSTPEYPPGEPIVLRDVMTTLLDHRDDLHVKEFHASLMASTLRTLEGIIDRGAITPAERRSVLRVAQVVLFSVL